jgi:hypothetical protein
MAPAIVFAGIGTIHPATRTRLIIEDLNYRVDTIVK